MSWNVNGQLTTKTINGVENVVTQVPWVCAETSGAVTAKQEGVVNLAYDPSSPFIAYDSLTEATVIGWAKDTLGTDVVTFYETKCGAVAQRSDQDETDGATTVTVFATYTPPETHQDTPW
tara:strand:+ start:534 stop:893 length:360 start_codon:yes stop_codon:yes gene_type:complete